MLDRGRVDAYVSQIADELIDWFAPAGRGDLVLRYSRPLTRLVGMGLLGMDESYAAGAEHAIMTLMREGQSSKPASQELDAALLRLVAEKRRAPGPDYVSWVLHFDAGLSCEDAARRARSILLGLAGHCAALIETALLDGRDDVATHKPVWGGVFTRADDLAAHCAGTALRRLQERLDDVFLPIPRQELLWEEIHGVRVPESLPAVFSPCWPVVTSEVRWLPDPAFDSPPPRPARAWRGWRRLLPRHGRRRNHPSCCAAATM
jgi:hypothetical protein